MKALSQLCLVLACLVVASHGLNMRRRQFVQQAQVSAPGQPMVPQVLPMSPPQVVAPVAPMPPMTPVPTAAPVAPVPPKPPGAPVPEAKMMQAVCNSAEMSLRFIYNMAQQAKNFPTVQLPALAAAISGTTGTVCQTYFQGAVTSAPVAQQAVTDYNSFFTFLCSVNKADPSRIRHASATLVSTQTMFKNLVPTVFGNSVAPDPRLPNGVCSMKMTPPPVGAVPMPGVMPQMPGAVQQVVGAVPQMPGVMPQPVMPQVVMPHVPGAVPQPVMPQMPGAVPQPVMPGYGVPQTQQVRTI